MVVHRFARLVLPCLALLCAMPARADDWADLQEATRKWRVHALEPLEPTLTTLRRSSQSDVALLATYLHARWLTRKGDGKAALAELDTIRQPMRVVSAPALDWAFIEALLADGQTDKAFARVAAFREQYKEFRWAAADLLYSRLSERAAKPEVAAQLALQLYEKSNLHLPRDELLARAARVRKSPELWRRLLLKHPESDYVDEAARVVDPAQFTDQEQFARMDLLFQRRAYERCRAIGLMLWAKGYRKSEVGWYLGKIGSERLRDDYPGAVTYLSETIGEGAPMAMTGLPSYALALLKVGKFDESVAQYDAWLKRFPDAPIDKLVELHYDRGRALRLAGKPLQASTDLAAFLDTHKSGFDWPKYWWFVGFWSYLGGDCKSAIVQMEPLLKRPNPLEGGKARYWTARCQDKLGQRAQAIETLAGLVQSMQLTWYGALAEEQLRAWGAGDRIPKLADLSKAAPPKPDPFAGLPKNPHLRRVRLATYLGEADLVQQVWEEEEKPLTQAIGKARVAELRTALADPLESYADERKRAVKDWGDELRRAPTADTVAHWRAIYPRAYATHVEAAAARHGVPEWMVYAHMLQESRYEPWLISGAPAYGLLELLDRTAARLARDAKEDYQLWMLMTPAWNVHWGAQYLGALVAKFHRQLPFAMASYNGGPMLLQYHMGVAKAAQQPLDEMIDDLGPHESRNYVRMVAGHFLRYLAIYETPKRAAELRAELLPADWKAAWLPYPDY